MASDIEFPARAGLNRRLVTAAGKDRRVPRASGVEPDAYWILGLMKRSSPRERG